MTLWFGQSMQFESFKISETYLMPMLRKTQPDNELKSRGYDENHSQFTCSSHHIYRSDTTITDLFIICIGGSIEICQCFSLFVIRNHIQNYACIYF